MASTARARLSESAKIDKRYCYCGANLSISIGLNWNVFEPIKWRWYPQRHWNTATCPPAISHFNNEIGTDLFACQTHFGSIRPATAAGKWVSSGVCSLWHKSRKRIVFNLPGNWIIPTIRHSDLSGCHCQPLPAIAKWGVLFHRCHGMHMKLTRLAIVGMVIVWTSYERMARIDVSHFVHLTHSDLVFTSSAAQRRARWRVYFPVDRSAFISRIKEERASAKVRVAK